MVRFQKEFQNRVLHRQQQDRERDAAYRTAIASADRVRSQSQAVTPTLQGLSRNGYVSMADLNAETNGSSYGTMGGELGGLSWTIRDSDRKLNAGVGELERLASRNADVGEDGTLTFRDQGSLGLYQKLLDLARSAEETRSSAVTQYNDTLDTYRKDFWKTQMPRTEQARILSDAIRTGEDASGFLPRQEPRAPIPGLTDVPDYLEQRQTGRGHGGTPFQAADRVREQATPEFVFEQLTRRENEGIERKIGELKPQLTKAYQDLGDVQTDMERARAELDAASQDESTAQAALAMTDGLPKDDPARQDAERRYLGATAKTAQARQAYEEAESRNKVSDIGAQIGGLRGQKYFGTADLDLSKLDETTLARVMQAPEWKQQAALNSGYETGDEFGGEAGQAWHQQQAGEAKAKLEALTEALRSQGFDDDQIERMYDVAQRQFNYEKTAEMTDVFSKAAGANAGTGALMTAASVPMNLASGLGHLAQTIGLITNRFRSDEDYVPLDYYDPMMQPYYGSTAIRGGAAAAISDSWAGPVGSFLYQTGTSILDSVTVTALTVATGLPVAALLGGSAATSSMMEAKARGATDDQAVAMGLLSGIFETLFEEVSIDKLLTLERPNGIRAFLKNTMKQAFTEGSEEVNTTIANTIADAVIMADRSEINTNAAAYEAEGLSAGEAKAKAWLDAVKGVGLDFLGGAISGGVMGGVRSAAMYGRYQHANASLGADVRVNQALDQVIQTGLEAGEGTEAYRQALRLQEKQQEGKTLSDRKVGALQRENLQGIQYSIDELQRMQASSLPENVKEAISSLVNGDGISSNQANAIYKTEGAIPYLERIIGTKLNTDQSISGVKNDIRALASRAVAQTQNDYIRGTMGFQMEDRAVRAAGTASQNGVERGLGSIDRVTDAEAQARNRADAPALAATLGENGSKAFSTVYEADTDLYQTFEGFAQVYNAALNDKAIPETEAVGRLPGYIRDVAADAGQRDAVRAAQAQYFGKDAGLVRDTAFRKMRLPVKTERVLDAIGKTAGVQVRFQDRIVDPKTGLSANAKYDNGVITIARDAADPVRAAFTHEIIHRIREASPGAYTSLARFVQEHMSDRGFQFNLEQRSELYGTGDIDLLTEETVADAFGQMLGDGRALEQFAMEHRTAAQKVMDGIRELLAKIRAVLGKDGKQAEVRLTDEQRAAFQDLAGNLEEMAATLYGALKQTAQSVETNTAQKNTAPMGGNAQYQLNPDFGNQFDQWYQDRDADGNLRTGGYLRVGTTSEALQSIGVDDYAIYWDKSKLDAIMKKHPEMTADVIKEVPQILEHPILVMQSQTVANRITLYGEVTAADGSPVMVAMELRPQSKRGEIQDFAKVASAYGRNTVQRDMNTSDILYLDPNKKRTNTWLEALRLQLPAGLTKYGSIANVTYVERDVNGKISFGETGGKTDMQIAMERALQTKKNTDQTDGGARYSLNADFERQFDQWMKKTTEAERLRSPEYFLIGNTSAALQSIGMKDYRIYFGQSKIAKIMNKHPAMTTDVIKSVPQVLEQPILVMQSQTTANRITMFGETMDADGKPVLVAVELSPQNKRGEVLDFSVIASAYGKTNAQQLIDNSDILFVEPNQKRTDSWLRLLGLQLPSRVTNYGSIASIFTVNRDVNGKISFGETGGKTDMQLAMERALQTKKNTDQTDGGARHSLKGMQKEITAQYQKTVDAVLDGTLGSTDAVIMGYTPDIYQSLGMPSLPFVIGPGHIYSAAKTASEAKAEGRYHPRTNYHGLGTETVKNLYAAAEKPLMIISAKDVNKNATPLRSTHSVVSIVDIGGGDKHLLLPIEITASRTVDGAEMDVNVLSSAYEKNVEGLVTEAIAQENAGEIGVYYVTKEAADLLGTRVQFPEWLTNAAASYEADDPTATRVQFPEPQADAAASTGIIRRFSQKINMNIAEQTQSQQFKRWFGDWQNKPNAASKVVNADGTPRVVYHGTAEDIHIFEEGRRGSLTRAADAREGYFFTSSERTARGYAQAAMPQELLELRDAFDRLDSRTDQDPELDRQLTEARDAFEKAFMAYRESGGGQVMPVYLSIKNPVIVDFAGESYQNNAGRVEAAISHAKQNGNDGVILRNILDPLGPRELRETADEFIVFQSEQIKSAAENIGTFDAANPDIRRSISNKEYLERYVQEYGAIPKGEKPYRSMEVPQKTGEHQRVSQTVRTVLEAKATPDAAIPNIEALLASGDFSYGAYTDKQAIRDADGVIRKKGWDAALRGWFDSVRSGQVSKTNTALGWALYNNAANSGNVETAIDILEAMVGHQRNAAQAVQATRILKKLNPETQLYGVQRSVESLQEELNERYGEQKAPTLVIDKALAERLMKAKNQQERDSALRDIYRDIGRQMPSRFLDKWNAWRYMAMLGNPRTHVRNILGNAVFAPVVAAKNLTATAIEAAVYRVSGGRLERSKGLLGPDAGSRGLLKAAWGDYGNVQEAAMSGGKYSDLANANRYVEEGRAVFQSKAAKPLESFRKANSKALDIEDAWFSQPHYAAAMAQYCKANGITAAQVQSGKGLEKARAYAIQEAQKATYRDTNSFSQWVSGLGRGMRSGKNPVTKAAGMAMEGILPFRKTPANILVRGLEYSPLGFLDGVKKAFFDVRKERCTGAEAIDRISAGLTGTGLLGLGIFLAAQGLIRGHGGDDEPEKAFQEMMGHQAYSLELPDGTSITLDWLAPESMPFFVGVNLWEMTQGEKEPLTLSTILSAAGTVTEPLLEMSCLQSVNAVFDAVGYASSNDLSGLETVLVSAAASYLTQALPTLAGQMERTAQNIRMTTYTEKNAFLTQDMQYTLGTASGRVPGVDYQQIPYIDAWGRTESTGSIAARAANNFLNPAFTSRIDASAMEAELLRLYDATGENGVFPSRAAKYFNVASERKDLTAEEYVKYATVKGQTAYRLMGAVTAAEWYQVLSDSEKVRVVGSVYEYANALAKSTVSQYQPDGWTAKAIEAETVYGISPDVYLRLRNATADLEGIPDPRSGGDSSIDNSKGLLIMQEVFQVSGMSDRQRRALFEAFGVGKSIQHWNKTLVGDKLQELERQAQSDAAELAAAGLGADDLRTLNEIRNSAEMKSERDVRDNVIRGKSREDKLRAWLEAYEGLSNEQRKYIWKNIFGYTSRW